MPVCPKCGFAQATQLTSPTCKATFTRPLPVPEESKKPVPSAALGMEIQIDRRTLPRAAPTGTAEMFAPPPVAAAPSPAEPVADDPWLQPPTESKPAPKPALRPAPKPVAPPARAASAAASKPVPSAAALARDSVTQRFGQPPPAPIASPAAPAPAAFIPAPPGPVALPKPATAPAPARIPTPAPAALAPKPPATPAPPPVTNSPPANAPSHRDEVLSAARAHQAAPEPKIEQALPKVSAPSEPPLSRATMSAAPPPSSASAEPGPDSQPPTAKSAEPAFVAAPRSMAVISAEMATHEVHAEPGGAFAQLGAGLVDAVLLGLLFVAYLAFAQAIAGRLPASEESGLDWLIDRAIAWRGVLAPGAALLAALWFVYTSLFHALGGKTLGKRLFGLTVVDDTGMPPGLLRSAARSLLSFFSAALLFMGFVLVLFDARKQALHDKLAGTFVVRLAD